MYRTTEDETKDSVALQSCLYLHSTTSTTINWVTVTTWSYCHLTITSHYICVHCVQHKQQSQHELR